MDEITQIKARCFELISVIELSQRELVLQQQRLQSLAQQQVAGAPGAVVAACADPELGRPEDAGVLVPAGRKKKK